jgi:hypothetical protein
MKDILPNGNLLLDEKDGQESKDNPKNGAPYHLPIEGTIYLKLLMVSIGYKYTICGKRKGASIMLCDLCQ